MNDETQRARQLILQHGWNATAYQILNPGIQLWFSRMGDAVIGYVVKRRVRVVAGAPICPAARLGEVLTEWENAAQKFGHKICYFGAAGLLYGRLKDCPDYSIVVLGAQPVWNPQNWAALIQNQKKLRAELRTALNKGVQAIEWSVEKAAQSAELERCLKQWLQTRGLPPLHFLVEPRTLHYLGDRRIWVAEVAGKPVGFLVMAPIPCRNGWLTEQFVRGENAPNGTVDLLLDTAIRAVAQDGATYLTMGLVPLSGQVKEANADNPLWLRFLTSWVRAHGRRFYHFEGLEKFKAKFFPESWEPIYAIAGEKNFAPSSLYAIVAAFCGRPPFGSVLRGLGKAARQEGRWLREKWSQR